MELHGMVDATGRATPRLQIGVAVCELADALRVEAFRDRLSLLR